MKLVHFNFLILGLALASLVGYVLSFNKLFLASLVIFGVWSLVNLIEYLIKKSFGNKPIKMVKE